MAGPSETRMIMKKVGHDARLIEAAEYIRKNVLGNISRRDIALRLNLSESYVGEYFRTHAGIGLSIYITTVRLMRARRLLRTTFLSVKEISYAVGYAHESNFDRAFKRRFGVSPLAYRKRVQRSRLSRTRE